jgi:hypothetical protein
MANLLLFFGVTCGVASFAFYTAHGSVGYVVPTWANTFCSAAPDLCRNPEWSMYAAVGFVMLWLTIKLAAAMRD